MAGKTTSGKRQTFPKLKSQSSHSSTAKKSCWNLRNGIVLQKSLLRKFQNMSSRHKAPWEKKSHMKNPKFLLGQLQEMTMFNFRCISTTVVFQKELNPWSNSPWKLHQKNLKNMRQTLLPSAADPRTAHGMAELLSGGQGFRPATMT